MSGVHDADSHLLTGHQDGGDVPTDKREDVPDPVGTEHSCHALAAVPGALHLRLRKVKGQMSQQVTDRMDSAKS